MDILDYGLSGGPDIYYDPSFRNVVEDHMTYLRTRPDNQVISIEPMVAYKYAGDYFGMLLHHKVFTHHHWIVMRINGLISPQDYRDTMLSFIKPPDKTMELLRSVYMSQSKLRK